MVTGPVPSSARSAVCPGQCRPHEDRRCLHHCDTPPEHVRTLSVDGSTNVSEGSTVVLFIDGDVRVLEHQHHRSIDIKQHDLRHRLLGLEFHMVEGG